MIIRREMKEKANLNWRGDGEFVHGGENGYGRLLSRRDGSIYTSQMSIKGTSMLVSVAGKAKELEIR